MYATGRTVSGGGNQDKEGLLLVGKGEQVILFWNPSGRKKETESLLESLRGTSLARGGRGGFDPWRDWPDPREIPCEVC